MNWPRRPRTSLIWRTCACCSRRWIIPERAFPSVLIAGTNGKGSTAATLASILRASGLKTGLYTSPHLIRINERIRMNGEEIADDDFALIA